MWAGEARVRHMYQWMTGSVEKKVRYISLYFHADIENVEAPKYFAQFYCDFIALIVHRRDEMLCA